MHASFSSNPKIQNNDNTLGIVVFVFTTLVLIGTIVISYEVKNIHQKTNQK